MTRALKLLSSICSEKIQENHMIQFPQAFEVTSRVKINYQNSYSKEHAQKSWRSMQVELWNIAEVMHNKVNISSYHKNEKSNHKITAQTWLKLERLISMWSRWIPYVL